MREHGRKSKRQWLSPPLRLPLSLNQTPKNAATFGQTELEPDRTRQSEFSSPIRLIALLV